MAEFQELAQLLCNFCFSTIQGHESGLYKGIKMKTLNANIKILQTETTLNIIKNITAHYLNKAYISLIKKDDPYIIEKFNEMTKINNHSAICLLNIIMAFIMDIHSSLNRSILDISSYDLYMKSVMNQVNSKYEDCLNALYKSISHECQGIDIKTCNPYEPLFFLT